MLRKGDQLFIERDREFAEVRSQPAELQTLFDDVSHQLFTESKRIEGVQETVNACVKQSKELESTHHKFEESHQMSTQMLVTRAWREDQDSEAPANEVALVWRDKFAEAFGNSDFVQSAVHRRTIAGEDSSKTVAQRALFW